MYCKHEREDVTGGLKTLQTEYYLSFISTVIKSRLLDDIARNTREREKKCMKGNLKEFDYMEDLGENEGQY